MARFRRHVLQEHTTFEQETIEPSITAPEIIRKIVFIIAFKLDIINVSYIYSSIFIIKLTIVAQGRI